MKYRTLLTFFLLTAFLGAQQKPSQEWLDRKFSMFIHFGLYSVYGGVYEGNPVTRGYSEQIQSFAGIFSDWYANTANEFNPVNWNPDSIVALAKHAGMGSIIFTSKHHDGFCMYHSAHTDFNIVDATPYGRDLMKELAEACARGGIGFGVYFSLIDWHYPQAYPISSHNADPLTPEHYAFNLKQVEEIMSGYGPLTEIWFDMGSLTPEQSKGLYGLVNRLQPQCMISGRLGNDYVDFSVMADNEYPDYPIGVPWQTAASMFNETWGYRSWQERGEMPAKVDEKIRSLIKVVSRGGNYLLNIGPRGDGSVVEFEQEVLYAMGQWVKANREAIHGAHANPFHQPFDWGDITTKDGALFAFVENMPLSRKIQLSGFEGKVKSVNVLSSGNSLPFRQDNDGLEIDLTSMPTPDIVPVVKIDFEERYDIVPPLVVKNGALTPQNALSLFGHSSLNYYAGYKSVIGYDWTFASNKQSVIPRISFTDQEMGRGILIEAEGQQQALMLGLEMITTKDDDSEDGVKILQTPTLPGEISERTEKIKPGSVQWGRIYRKPGKGVFGNVEEEGQNEVNVDSLESAWRQVENFRYGEFHAERISPRGSILFLQEIISSKEQTIAVNIGSGNAMYLLLNGEYVTAHFSPERIEQQEEMVLLPLKKGKNQLIIKFYNGFENTLHYKIEPRKEWKIYTQKLYPVSLRKSDTHKASLRSLDSPSNVSPLRLNNVRILFH